jgi:hypothetical protein
MLAALYKCVRLRIRYRKQRDVVYLAVLKIRIRDPVPETKGCRLPWLINSALVYEPKFGGGVAAGYQPVSIQLFTGAQINFGDVTFYFTNAGTDPPFQNKPTDSYPDLIKKLFHKRIIIFLF